MSPTQVVIPLERSAQYLLDPDAGPTGVFDLEAIEEELSPEDRARVIAGRYEIVEHLGAGGMGQVLKVRHRRLGKMFALKLMQSQHALDAAACALFKKEARVASALCHPHIVSVVDFGEDPDWGLFITMELLDGESLLERVRRNVRLPVELACRVGAQIAAALAHSHAHRVIHADVKTENVVCIGTDDDDLHVKLLDFGTAQIASRSNTHDGVIAGTPAYIAPERITGKPPQPSNDIYSLGILLYELLTGTPPFQDENVAAILHAHLHDEPPDVGAQRGEVLDDRLVAIVHKAIHKNPTERYETAEKLCSDLEDYRAALGARQRELEQRVGIADYTHEEAAADAFDALGIPAAGLDVDGTIRIANAAFARLIKEKDPRALKARSVLSTNLSDVHPDIREDLRLVSMTGKLIRRRVRVLHPDGSESLIRLLMTPSQGRCGSCMLAIHPLPPGR